MISSLHQFREFRFTLKHFKIAGKTPRPLTIYCYTYQMKYCIYNIFVGDLIHLQQANQQTKLQLIIACWFQNVICWPCGRAIFLLCGRSERHICTFYNADTSLLFSLSCQLGIWVEIHTQTPKISLCWCVKPSAYGRDAGTTSSSGQTQDKKHWSDKFGKRSITLAFNKKNTIGNHFFF